jgi:hypothetical protein
VKVGESNVIRWSLILMTIHRPGGSSTRGLFVDKKLGNSSQRAPPGTSPSLFNPASSGAKDITSPAPTLSAPVAAIAEEPLQSTPDAFVDRDDAADPSDVTYLEDLESYKTN